MKTIKEQNYTLVNLRKLVVARMKASDDDVKYCCKMLGVPLDSYAGDYIFDYLYNGGNIKRLRKELAQYKKENS